MLDTRLLGRDKQVAFTDLLNPATAAAAMATLASPTRTLELPPNLGDLNSCFFDALEFLDHPQETGYQRGSQTLRQTDHMHMRAQIHVTDR